MTDTPTKSELIAEDVVALLRARNPLLWVVTGEEARVESYLMRAAQAAKYIPRTWDVAAGCANMKGEPLTTGSKDPGEMLDVIRDRAVRKDMVNRDRGVWIMRDLPTWLEGPGGAATLRAVRNLARLLPGCDRDSAQSLIVLSPNGNVPPELAGHATVIEWPMPDRAEIAELLDSAIESLPEEMQTKAAPNGTRDAAIDAAVGLSGEEAQGCYAKSLVQLRRIDPAAVAKEKRRVIARERVLEWFDPIPGGLDAVGGLDLLKGWLKSRALAYSPAARAYGLPAPKGAMLVGIPGCGKSLTAKAIATAWGVPLLRLDMGALKSKFVGDSEANIRKAFRVIEAIGRCVVWIDEIEKALEGATSGAADGGVSSDALGAILNWMQERSGEAFVIATANKVENLPPELLRKGRFDEVWFVDLPTLEEREQILIAALKAHGRTTESLDLRNTRVVAQACNGFTGSEIAAIVPEALFAAFAQDGRALSSADLVAAARKVVPLGTTAAEKIAALRTWAKTRARPATSATTERPAEQRAGRNIDVDA